MTSKERVKNAMHYKRVDKAPLQYYYTPVGYYEHGEKLNDLYATLPGDFEPFRRVPVPVLSAADFDENGKYHAFHTDEWNVQWEHRIFGITGIPYKHPITCEEDMESYCLPPAVTCQGAEFDAYASSVKERSKQGLYCLEYGGNIFERLLSLYGDENVLCDIAMDEPGINKLTDKIVEYDAALVERAIKAGADGISVGDDYGTEREMLMSPECWRKFFKPRWKKLFQPAVDAGLEIHFHSCGQVMPILEDLREIGVTSIWPQLPAYNMKELADHCRKLGLAVAIHTDRAKTMTYGTSDEVRELIKREFDTFQMMDGGSWFYVEADNGFPFANIEAQIETIAQWR